MPTQTVQLRRIKDTYVSNIINNQGSGVYSYDNIVNFGRANTLYVADKNGSSVNQKIIYIYFNKSEIVPDNAIITNFVLKTFITDLYGANSNIILDLHAIIDPWDEYSVTYNNRPKIALLKSNFLTISSSSTYPFYLDINLTNYLEQMSYGFALTISTSCISTLDNSASLSFNSNENTNQLYAEITYTTDVPQKPILTYPLSGEVLNKNTSSTYRFTWDSTSQQGFDIQYSTNGINWTTITQTTSNKYYDFNISSLNTGNLFWRIRIKDSSGLYSQFTENVKIQIGSRPTTPAITLTGALTSNPVITWGKDLSQTAYQVQILKNSTVVEDSGVVETVGNVYNLKNRLENNTAYTIKLKIKNILDIWSVEATQSITTNFTNPGQPVITINKNDISKGLTINIANSNGTETTILNEIYKSEDNINFNRIGNNITVNSTFTDYAIESNKIYYYKVRALGNNGYFDSAIGNNSVSLNVYQLLRLDTKEYINIKYNLDVGNAQKQDIQFLKFAGRKKEVGEYSESDAENIISISFTLDSKDDYIKLLSILNSKQILLYRDIRGRKIYCNEINRNIKDNDFNRERFELSLSLKEVDYSEVI